MKVLKFDILIKTEEDELPAGVSFVSTGEYRRPLKGELFLVAGTHLGIHRADVMLRDRQIIMERSE